jgi:LPS-assembly protein
MANPIHLKKAFQLQLFISLLASPLAISAADKSGWDCHQDKVSGEWSCVTEKQEQTAPLPHEGGLPNTQIKSVASPQQPVKPQEAKQITSTKKPAEMATVAIIKPLIPKQPGWGCAADKENGGWDCKLTKAAPSEKTKLAASQGNAKSSSEQLTSNDEILFQNMLNVIPQDPWGNCGIERGAPVISRTKETAAIREQSPAYIESNFSEALESDEFVTFSGNVEFKRADQTLHADKLTHDQFANTISAQGNVLYREEGMTFQSEKSFMWLNSDRGKLHNSQFIFETTPARGSSQLTSIESKTLTRHSDVTYTTCRPGNRDWELEASRLSLDQASGVGTASDVWVHFKDVPLFYAPWMTFPIDDRRKSGFLVPSFGNGNGSGFVLATPYYWNIAPNYDAVITPRYLSDRGLQLGTEFRHLGNNSESTIALGFITNDKETGEDRGHLNIKSEATFNKKLTGNLNVNIVSDDDYINDFRNALTINSSRQLYSNADLNYQGNGWSLLGRLDGYQTIDNTISSSDQPYRRLPQIFFNMDRQEGPAGSKLDLQTEFVYFDKGDSVTGKRLNIQPEISFPLRTSASFLTPKLALQATHYWLEDQSAGDSDSISRTTPILSVDSGLFFERDLQFSEQSWQQTLEPRLFYLYIPHKDQDDIPLFDTGENDFSLNQLFRTNRFNGIDRINDANQLSAALTTRFLEADSGRERLRASIGQIFYFEDSEITVPGGDPITNNGSDLVTELAAVLTENWSLRTRYQWDPYQGDSSRANASLRYRDGIDRLFNLSYQFREDSIDQTDVSLRWPITDSWHGVARWNYSLSDQTILDSFIGVEKENCCWRFKVLVRSTVNDVDSDPDTAFFFQVELKGLTSFGQKLDSVLSQTIPGYQLP